jgi:hypothetical protein
MNARPIRGPGQVLGAWLNIAAIPRFPAEIDQSDQSRAGASQDATKAATRRITLGSASRGA